MERLNVYKCALCGNIVELKHAGGGPLTCCGQAMDLLAETTTDAAVEKHVPVVEKIDGGYVVKVGSVDHPMEEKHYIQWIELIADGVCYTHYLSPGDPPVATFKLEADNVTARAYCNLHGNWKA